MKKVTIILVAILMVLTACTAHALAEQGAENWYELSADNTVLTVRLPGNTKNGLAWTFEISNPEALELITHETIEGEYEGMAGAQTEYVASFMTMACEENTASLILQYRDESAPEEAAVATRVLEVSTEADNSLIIESVLVQEASAEWCEVSEEGEVLTVRLPADEWRMEIVDGDIVELITCEDTADAYTASFMATMEKVGMAEIVFTEVNGMNSRAVTVFVNEGGCIYLERVEMLESLGIPDYVFCNECLSFYLAGEEFENHVCVETEEEPDAEEEPVSEEFKTVNITGSTVNMRSGAGVDYEVEKVLKKGDNAKYLGVTRIDERDMEWHKISFAGKTGWVSAKYAKLGGQGYVKTLGEANVREMPDLDAEVLATVKKGTVITYLGQGETDSRGVDWYKVSYNKKTGWISSKYAQFTATAETTSKTESKKSKTEYKYFQIQGGSCNLRKSASVNADSIMVLKKGTVGSYLGEKATDSRGVDWYKVSYNKKTGWVSSKLTKLYKSKPSSGGGSSKKKDDTKDMRKVYNPKGYKTICVTDIYSQNGKDVYVVGYFGTVNKKGECEYFDQRNSVTMKLTKDAVVKVPKNVSTGENIKTVKDPYIWFNNVRKEYGGNYSFYASFGMNKSGNLTSLTYKLVY